MRLQALDFWLRNPDYLADELLDEYEAGRRPDALNVVRKIFDDQEPDLRRLPMARSTCSAPTSRSRVCPGFG